MTKLEFEGSLGVRGCCFPAMTIVASRHRPSLCKKSARMIAIQKDQITKLGKIPINANAR